jgi:hypothetical protein
MTVVTVYVKSPISGSITGRTYYCTQPGPDPDCYGTSSNGTHYSCMSGWYYPVDISGTGTLYLNVNYPNVLSVITWVSLICCGSGCDASLRRIITVELYGRQYGRCYIGSIEYGHVNSVYITNGATYNLTSGSLSLGTVSQVSGCSCSTGAHAHMAVNTSNSQTPQAPCCGGSVTTATNIYKFTWDNSCV